MLAALYKVLKLLVSVIRLGGLDAKSGRRSFNFLTAGSKVSNRIDNERLIQLKLVGLKRVRSDISWLSI